ncbi:MAG: LD-carboxypeptidase [Clostridia bacterium]|nr:LD-carboxypeptidase [Clostridia bacterium]
MLCGGYNCNSVFDYLDYDVIKNNPKIICGYSDPTSIINMIYAKTGLVTFHGPNFKSLSDEETDYGYKEVIKRFFEKDLRLGTDEDEFKVIREGKAERSFNSEEICAYFQI